LSIDTLLLIFGLYSYCSRSMSFGSINSLLITKATPALLLLWLLIIVIFRFSYISIISLSSLSFVFYMARTAIFLSLIVMVMSLYLDCLFVYLFPLTLRDANFHNSILELLCVFFSIFYLWGSCSTLLVAKPFGAMVEVALAILFWDLEMWVSSRLISSFVFRLPSHGPKEANGTIIPMLPSIVLF